MGGLVLRPGDCESEWPPTEQLNKALRRSSRWTATPLAGSIGGNALTRCLVWSCSDTTEYGLLYGLRGSQAVPRLHHCPNARDPSARLAPSPVPANPKDNSPDFRFEFDLRLDETRQIYLNSCYTLSDHLRFTFWPSTFPISLLSARCEYLCLACLSHILCLSFLHLVQDPYSACGSSTALYGHLLILVIIQLHLYH